MKSKALLSIFVIPCLLGCSVTANKYTYKNSDKYTRYTGTVTVSDKVENLLINYVSGSVSVTKGAELKLIEEENTYPCYYWNDSSNKKFTIEYVENGLDLSNKDFSKKNLFLTIPYDLKTLTLNLVSCNYSIDVFNVDEFTIDVVSSNGKVSLEENKKVNFNSVSGSLNLKISSTLNEEKISIDTVSGGSVLELDQRRGFEPTFHGLSGNLINNFGEATDPSLNKYSIDIDTISGVFTIKKALLE